jgi:Protein of unknown function (DUF2934)
MLTTNTPEHEATARLAYSYWTARGCPEGSPEQDWFRAEQELQRQRDGIKLHFTEETPLGYTSDYDFTLVIPVTGPLGRLPREYKLNDPQRGSFTEKFCPGRSRAPDRSPRAFPAVVVDGNLYFLWVEERREWVGLYYRLETGPYEQNIYGGGHEEHIDVSGPFQLNEECGRCIAQAYGCKTQNFDDVLHSSPGEIENGTLRKENGTS